MAVLKYLFPVPFLNSERDNEKGQNKSEILRSFVRLIQGVSIVSSSWRCAPSPCRPWRPSRGGACSWRCEGRRCQTNRHPNLRFH